MFNLLYPVFHVGFICKGYVWERERERVCVCVCEDSRKIDNWSVFTGSSRVSIPQSDACALHMTGMWKVRIWWRQLVFASVSWVRPSCETLPVRYPRNSLFCYFVLFAPLHSHPHYIYRHYSQMLRNASERKP